MFYRNIVFAMISSRSDIALLASPFMAVIGAFLFFQLAVYFISITQGKSS